MIQIHLSIIIFFIIFLTLGVAVTGFIFSNYYFFKTKVIFLFYSSIALFFGILAVISRLLMFHPNSAVRNIGIQTSILWITCVVAGFFLLIKSFDEENLSLPEIALTFWVIGILIAASLLNAWIEIEISPGFYQTYPGVIELLFILVGVTLFSVYVGAKFLLYLNRSRKIAISRNRKIQIKLMIISLGIVMPVLMTFQLIDWYLQEEELLLKDILTLIRSIGLLVAAVLLILAIVIMGKNSFPYSHKIYRLIITNFGGVPIYHRHFHPDDYNIDEVLITAATTTVSMFYHELMKTHAQIKEIIFDEFSFLCKFMVPREEEKIPAYSCILITKKKSMVIKNAFKRFCEQFDLKFREEIKNIVGNRLEPEMEINSLVNEIFGQTESY